MSADDARDLFGDAIDETLSPDAKAAFESVLAANAELNEEYESYRAVVQGIVLKFCHSPVQATVPAGILRQAAPAGALPLANERLAADGAVVAIEEAQHEPHLALVVLPFLLPAFEPGLQKRVRPPSSREPSAPAGIIKFLTRTLAKVPRTITSW